MLRIVLGSLALTLLVTPSVTMAGWPFFSDDGLIRGTPEYYESKASAPVGSRQKYYFGKLWPPRARPVGPSQTFVHKYHSSHFWPHPYIEDDRATVNQVMHTQTANGWQSGTTLYEYHFDPVTHELNRAGRTHLRWILTNAPVSYRQAFVSTASAPAHSQTRITSVEREIANLIGTGSNVPVALRVTDPLGRPASEVQQILQSAQDGAPAPTIQYTSAQSGGG